MLGDFPKLGHQKPSTMAPSYRVADRARGARPPSRMSSRTWFPALRRGRLPLCAPHWTRAPRPRAQAELGLSPTRPTLGARRSVPTLQTSTGRLGPKAVTVPWVGGDFSHCALESLRFVQMKNKIRAKGENAILKIENKRKQKNLIMYRVGDKTPGREVLFPET